MTRRRALRAALGLVAAAALSSCVVPVPVPAPSRAAAEARLTLVTLNLYHDADQWDRRRPLVIEGLRALRPDVIALQEVLQKDGLRNQAEDIGAALGYAVHFVSTDPPGAAQRYGNAILTRLPVLARSERRLRPLDDSRTVAHVRVEIDGRALDVFNTHLHWTDDGGAIRARQLQDVLAHVAAQADGAPHLLAGDFNAEAGAPELAALRQAGYVDALAAAAPAAAGASTLNPHYFERGRRIDHVFAHGRALRPLRAHLVLDAPDAGGTWPSDHFGVLAEFAYRP